jgi:hypothetical protein
MSGIRWVGRDASIIRRRNLPCLIRGLFDHRRNFPCLSVPNLTIGEIYKHRTGVPEKEDESITPLFIGGF